MTRLFLTASVWLCCLAVSAQNTAIEQYNQFRKQAQQEYADFRKQCNAKYAEFLKSAWESYVAGPVIPKPKDEGPLPPPSPIGREPLPIEGKPLPIDTVVAPVIEDAPQPKPIAPIYEVPEPVPTWLTFSFFGTEGKVRVPGEQPKQLVALNKQISGNALADAWDALSGGDYDNTMRDCLELRIRHQLCDWAYLQMIRELSERYCGGRCNAATFFTAWIYCQTGYQMRLALTENGRLYLLIGSAHQIYGWCNYLVDGVHFYPFLHDGEQMPDRVQISGAPFPEEQPLSLFVPNAQSFSQNYGASRTVKSNRYPNVSINVKVNQNLMKFYETYPTSMLDDNFVTRWAMYANTPMADDIKSQLYPQLTACITGKSQLDAANILLNWVQTGLVYEYDDKVWGGDRAFFAEESLNYPYCDCEDRSILYTRLVRDLLGLDCILIYYPGHLACAVHFTENVAGDYINLGGQKFVVTDPTYIGAPVGYTMTGMDNKAAKVILLRK